MRLNVENISDKDRLKLEIKNKMKPIEANVVGCFWKNINLYFDYSDMTRHTFKNQVWQFYFDIGKKLANKNIKEIDDVAIKTLLKDSKKSLEKYVEFGEYNTIEKLEFFVTVDNAESYIGELKKWSALYDIIDKVYLDDVNDLNQFSDLNSNELYDFVMAHINNIFINSDDGIESFEIQDGLDEVIDEADKGVNVGMPIPSKILSSEIGGVIDGQIILFGGLSGTGKTTITIQLLLAACFEEEEPLVVMLNEQDEKLWKRELLTYIINNKLVQNDEKMFAKKRWRTGGFTEEERSLLNQAKEYLQEKMKNNKIILIHFKSYSRKQAERVIRKYSSLGVKKFILDTFKLSSDRNDNEQTWLSLQEDVRKFDDLVKPSNLNVNLWMTLQLQKGSVLKRYLTGDNIGLGKNVLDTASVTILMRRVRNDEYAGEKNEIKVIQPIGGSLKSGKPIELNPNKKYVILFLEKNRNGESQSYQIVAEQDLSHLVYKEVGITDIPFDT
ncbi:hypothetical protein [Halalkalibacter oceani]|uniref:hypothetical protein n=1 Tax=Halalkalibacter oceani TaxID=1653776 RepID=UPI003395F989